MSKLRNVDTDLTDAVLTEAIEMSDALSFIGTGGFEYAREVLEKSLGAGKAAEIMGRLSAVIEARPFEFLRRTPPEQIVAFLRAEAPQTMALTIANLHTQLAAEVLAQLPPETQAEVALRIATMSSSPNGSASAAFDFEQLAPPAEEVRPLSMREAASRARQIVAAAEAEA